MLEPRSFLAADIRAARMVPRGWLPRGTRESAPETYSASVPVSPAHAARLGGGGGGLERAYVLGGALAYILNSEGPAKLLAFSLGFVTLM